ncbi:MAG: DUF72 domain-containing protein [Deltaproteobacteria bacterium]|nr:DUF72 domain-containing protein [Deltaproteobacteria bacterium]
MEGKRHSEAASSCRLWVGTCGYSYKEWVETGFYPPDTKPGKMLSLYVKQFPITELNYTWYQMPRAEAVERQRRQTPSQFMFAAKLTRSLTHEVEPGAWRDQATAYRDGIAPLVQAKQLSAVLVQLPPGFDRSVKNRAYLAKLLDALEGLPLAVEFRHNSWAADRVFAELEKRRVTLVAVDEPNLPGLFPALDVVTNPDLFYIRFHGRNAAGWGKGKKQVQFDYDYTEDELKEWVQGKIIGMTRRARGGVIVFNNHVRAQAPKNASALTRLLLEYGLLLVRK